MIAKNGSYGDESGRRRMMWAMSISMLGHLLLVGIVVFQPDWSSRQDSLMPPGMNVQMVDLSSLPAASSSKSKETKAEAEVKKEAPQEKKEVPPPVQKPEVQVKETVQKPEVSLAPKELRSKVALKYKTYQPQDVIKKALDKIEEKVESTPPPNRLEDTFKELREKVAREERSGAGQKNAETTGPADIGVGAGTGSARGAGGMGQKELEIIDLYRLEIGYEINSHWAMSEQLMGGTKMMTLLEFKVLPDGRIIDIFFVERSGNPHLDDQAYKAIVKASPVKQHPDGIKTPYVHMGVRFTPEGLK